MGAFGLGLVVCGIVGNGLAMVGLVNFALVISAPHRKSAIELLDRFLRQRAVLDHARSSMKSAKKNVDYIRLPIIPCSLPTGTAFVRVQEAHVHLPKNGMGSGS